MKWLFITFLVVLVLVLGVGGFGYLQMKMHQAPSIEDAPWIIQTFSQDGMNIPSRVYYATDVDIVDGQPIIREYWMHDGGRYKKYAEEKVLPANSYVVRRKQ